MQLQIDELKEYVNISDEICDLYGVPFSSTHNILFGAIADRLSLIMKDQAQITLTVKTEDGTPIPNLLVNGILSSSGTSVTTNDSGVASGYVTAGTRSLSITGYADLTNKSKSYTFVKGNTYSDEWEMETKNYVRYNSSATIKFSPLAKTISYSLCGGGGGGGTAFAADKSNEGARAGGGGGGGGHSVCVENVSVTHTESYRVSIGTGGSSAKSGGTSTFMSTTASGGSAGSSPTKGGSAASGGYGNGNGGSGAYYSYGAGQGYSASSGTNGTAIFYTSYTNNSTSGGGGGGGAIEVSTSVSQGFGAGYGGNGGSVISTGGLNPGGSGSSPGGGGGGGASGNGGFGNGIVSAPGSGGAGALGIRIYF